MPALLRSSETAGCGATIELDNTEVVFVSIAQTGVLVRLIDLKGGLIKTLVSNWFGPTLYNEKNVFKNAEAAQALSIMFPEEAPSLSFKNPVLTAFANAIWHCSSAAEVSIVLNEALAKAPKHSRAERLFDVDLDKRPITRAMLLRAAEVNDDNEKWLNSLGRKSHKEKPTTLAKEIQSAVLIDALRITTDAQEAIGLKWNPFLPGDPLSPHTNLVATFALFVIFNIVGQLRKEGHNDPDDSTLFPRLVDALFLTGSTDEKTNIYKLSLHTFNQVLRSDAPNVREWVKSLSDLVVLYLIGDEKLKQRGFPFLFGSMLKSLLSAAE
jgi:hypothetical protein